MTEAYSKALDKKICISRIIGEIHGEQPGPIVVFTAGIHGNEPSGVFALYDIIADLKDQGIPVKGAVYAIAGNLRALAKQKRFSKKDLNRLWFDNTIERLKDKNFKPCCDDEQEQLELYEVIEELLQKHQGPFYFMDLHTTSSDTVPFLTVNDSLLNRKFTSQFPIPIILGIEEYIQGPLLSYINELGYVSFGYEAGQHDALSAIENQKAFVHLSLVFTGSISTNAIHYQFFYKQLTDAVKGIRGIYEIYHRYAVRNNSIFQMNPGFYNFQKIKKGTELAVDGSTKISASENTRMFMPLYQNQGNDGFFFIRPIAKRVLHLSAVMRQRKMDKLLVFLPGISWGDSSKSVLKVNRKVARFYSKQIFHLLGYRTSVLDQDYYLLRNREAASKNTIYANEKWYV